MAPPAALDAVYTFLRETGSSRSVPEAVDRAIRLWIATESNAGEPGRGYQWKQLFLPEGTLAMLCSDDVWRNAKVVGDELVYRGNAVSPHQLTQAALGDGRNAWREIWLRFPSQNDWTNAGVLRARLTKAEAHPLTPADAMTAAANMRTTSRRTCSSGASRATGATPTSWTISTKLMTGIND